jgi:hypothetical protein
MYDVTSIWLPPQEPQPSFTWFLQTDNKKLLSGFKKLRILKTEFLNVKRVFQRAKKGVVANHNSITDIKQQR